jgi:hypothetical protein
MRYIDKARRIAANIAKLPGPQASHDHICRT